MRKIDFLLVTMGCLFFFCGSETKQGDLLEILVDVDQNISLPLSEIAEEIVAIDLELTAESLINPDRIRRVLLCEDVVIIAHSEKILVFDRNGKFIRSIGSEGQGPGEYTMIRNLGLNEKDKRLFINANSKIICYDLEGNLFKESTLIQQNGGSIIDINYINDELLLIVEQVRRKDEKGLFNHSAVWRLNDELQVTDSCTIRNTYFERPGFFIHPYENFILHGKSCVYLYYSDLYSYDMNMPVEVVLRDTLYRFENNQLVPELKLKFRNDGMDGSGNKFIEINNIYRSSRYVFSIYHNDQKGYSRYFFCYDTKTGKGYNMQDGFTDDIHQIEKRVNIRPFNLDTEMFYYLHTNMDPDDLEEPNPTLYIGRLKK